jgi:hypothetical protein
MTRYLLPVTDQHLLARPTQPAAVLLQARQHDHIAVIHVSPAKSRDIPRTGVLPLLRGRCVNHQKQRDDEKNSGHVAMPAGHELIAF